jgi:hypothetical protein
MSRKVWDLWRTTWHWGRFCPDTSVYTVNSCSTEWSSFFTHISLNPHSGLKGLRFRGLSRSLVLISIKQSWHSPGTRDQFFFLLEIFFRQLRVCYFVAPSLTRGRVCKLLLLLVFANAVALGSESHGTQDHILLFEFLRAPKPGGPGPRIYISQKQGGPDIPPNIGFPFRRLLRLAELVRRYSIPPPHGKPVISDKLSDYKLLETDPIPRCLRMAICFPVTVSVTPCKHACVTE